MSMDNKKVTRPTYPALTGKKISLIPIVDGHYQALKNHILKKPDSYRYTTIGSSETSFQAWFLQAQQASAFTVVDNMSTAPIGSSRFYDINAYVKRLAIGYTWYSTAFRGTGVNTEAKLLLLTYVFETMGYVRVEFHIDNENRASRRAVEKLGATLEAELRQHRRRLDGYLCNTCTYSIIDSEWLAVKASLQQRLS